MCRVHLDVRAISPFYYLVKSSTKCLTVRAAALTFHRFPAEPMLFLFYEANTCLHFGAPGFGVLHTPSRGPRSASLGDLTLVFCMVAARDPPAIRCRSWAVVTRSVRSHRRRGFVTPPFVTHLPQDRTPALPAASSGQTRRWAGPRSLSHRSSPRGSRMPLEWVVTAQRGFCSLPRRITVSAPEEGAWICPHKFSLGLKVSFHLRNINYNGLVKCSNDQNQAFDELSFNLCIYSHANTLH